MVENSALKTEHRNYLLGITKTEQDLTLIEEKLMTSEEYFQELLIEEEELTQDYADGHLDSYERECFEKFFLNSAERREKVKFAESLSKFISEQKKPQEKTQTTFQNETYSFWERLWAKPLWTAVGGLAVVAIVSLLVWNFAFRPAANSEIIASLNKAYQKERPFESRITSFDYAPANNQRGNDKAKYDSVSFDLAKAKALQGVSDNPNTSNLHSLGKVYLAEKELDKAIEQLEKAQRLASNNGEITSDLGVAWLEKSKTVLKNGDGKTIDYLAKALENFEKALEIRPDLLEARFNKAVCLEQQKLPIEAIEAWQQYLNADSNSKWAEEARQRLKILELSKPSSKTGEEILQEFLAAYQNRNDLLAWKIMSQNREMLTGKLITQQLAFLFSQTLDRKFLEALIYAGTLEKTEVNDSFWKEVADFYQKASPAQLSKLKQAQSHFQAGYQASANDKWQTALEEFKQARQLYLETGDVREENLATFWIGVCQYISANLTESKKELQNLLTYSQNNKYNWLLAQAQFWLGVNLGSENQKSAALSYYQKALKSSESVGDLYNSQKILSETAEEYRLLGRTDLSLEYLQKSLFLSDYPESSIRQKSRTYINLVRAFYSNKFYRTALAYEKENRYLLKDKEVNSLAFEHESDLRLGLILLAQKKYDEALAVFEKSKALSERYDNKKQGEGANARSILRIAELQRQKGQYAMAIANYDQAVRHYDLSEYKAEQYEAHKGRLFCYLAAGKDVEFERELETVLTLFEKYRGQILDEQNRNIFFNNEQNVYDIAVDYEYGRGNFQKAFDYAEKSSSRSLLDLMENGSQVKQISGRIEVELKKVAEPLTIDQIRQQMPTSVQIIKFNVLSDKVLIWVVSKDGVEAFSGKVSFADLQEKIIRLKALIENKQDEKEIYDLSTELYKILLSPISEKLDSDKQICLIPDKSLFQLPFAVLTSPLTQKPLLAEKNFFIAPSANVFLYLTTNAKKFSSSLTENILSIGNPTLSQSSLPDLPSAKNEAITVAKEYQKPILLLENDATKENVKQYLSRADIIHFAGHYVVNEHSPLLSSLILRQSSPDEEEKNYQLANYELLNENLASTKLVVLSACETGIESYYQGEGMIGASRTFLAAGIPLVVASQWAVDSDATSELMIRFHKYRKTEKLPTIFAVRKAQLDLLNGDDLKYRHPYYWSSFITIGGYAEF